VRLALAQLSPRHREAIVATVFEEKTSQQAAKDMGLSENAFRQLLLRARRSFKTVFVGEAEAANMSVSEALNLAAKRHRMRLISGTTLVGLLIVALALPAAQKIPTGYMSISGLQAEEIEIRQVPNELAPTPTPTSKGGDAFKSVSEPPLSISNPDAIELDDSDATTANIEQAEPLSPVMVSEEISQASLQSALEAALLSDLRESPLYLDSSSVLNPSQEGSGPELRVAVSSDIQLVADLRGCENAQALSLCKVYLEDSRNGKTLVWLSTNFAYAHVAETPDQKIYEVVATDFLVGDFGGEYGNVAVSQVSVSEASLLRFRLSLDDLGFKVSEIEFIQTRT